MGRAREFDAEQVAIAVTDLVLARGYDAVGVDDIVRQSGVGRGSLYQAFGSKAGVIAMALDHAVETSHPGRTELAALLLASSAREDPDVRRGLDRCLRSIRERPLSQALGQVLLKRHRRPKEE